MPRGFPALNAAEPQTEPAPVQPSEKPVWMVPGLGCRHVGMGADLLGRDAAADRIVRQASERIGIDVPTVCLTGSSRKPLPAKLEAQAIYTISSAYAEALLARGQRPACVIGHSLGTYSALYAAGALDFSAGLDLVTQAEELMESMIPPASQALGVVIALPLEKVLHLLGPHPDLRLANENCPGQYVVGGRRDEVEALLDAALAAGAYKAKPVPGARAVHTPLLREVQNELAAYVRHLPLRSPRFPVVSAIDGQWLRTADEIRDYLSVFLVRPVLWEQAVKDLTASGHLRFVEVGPAAVLTDMMPYIDKRLKARTASEELLVLEEPDDAPVERSAVVRQ